MRLQAVGGSKLCEFEEWSVAVQGHTPSEADHDLSEHSSKRFGGDERRNG